MRNVTSISSRPRKGHKVTFKFIPECTSDVWGFFAVLTFGGGPTLVAAHLQQGIVTFTVEDADASRVSLDAMRRVAACVADGHYILETINTPDKFTGKRYFSAYTEGPKVNVWGYVESVPLVPLEDVKLLPCAELEPVDPNAIE